MKMKIIVSIGLLLMSVLGFTEDGKKGVEALAPELRALLQQEMRSIEAAMKDMVSYNASGDFEQVEKLASQIENSFILKQNLTEQQRHQLHTLLPDDFLKQDEQFHYDAGMLQHVAANKKSELISYYYGKLLESCGNCHQIHAKHRFPKFEQIKTNSHH